MRYLLEVDSIQKTFDNKILLSDVCLHCKTNEIIGLLGRNGTGKSTLLKIIFGIEKADYKFVRINGKQSKNSYTINNGIAYLPQDSFVPKYLSVKKVIELFIHKNQITSFYNDDLINKIRNDKTKHLSGGELRYLEIKLILFSDAKFVLLDEPFNGISPIQIELIKNQIVQKSKNKGIILTDHNYQHILNIATKLTLIKDRTLYHLKEINELKKLGYLNY